MVIVPTFLPTFLSCVNGWKTACVFRDRLPLGAPYSLSLGWYTYMVQASLSNLAGTRCLPTRISVTQSRPLPCPRPASHRAKGRPVFLPDPELRQPAAYARCSQASGRRTAFKGHRKRRAKAGCLWLPVGPEGTQCPWTRSGGGPGGQRVLLGVGTVVM